MNKLRTPDTLPYSLPVQPQHLEPHIIQAAVSMCTLASLQYLPYLWATSIKSPNGNEKSLKRGILSKQLSIRKPCKCQLMGHGCRFHCQVLSLAWQDSRSTDEFCMFCPSSRMRAGGGVMDDDVGGVRYFSGPSGPRLGRNRDV